MIDTHIFRWAVAGSSSLKPTARRLIESAEQVFVSAASIWEIAIKSRLGKLDADPDELVQAISEPLKLLTADAVLTRYGEFVVIG